MNQASRRELYVYWRVAAADLSAARDAARAMQIDLRRAHPGLRVRLLKRCDGATSDAEVTLMEVYRHPAGIDDTLLAAIESAATPLAPWRRGDRHVEAFAPCSRAED